MSIMCHFSSIRKIRERGIEGIYLKILPLLMFLLA